MEIILALLETDLAVTVIAITLIWAGSKLVTTTSLLNPCLRRYVYSSWLLYVCVHICVCVCVCVFVCACVLTQCQFKKQAGFSGVLNINMEIT